MANSDENTVENLNGKTMALAREGSEEITGFFRRQRSALLDALASLLVSILKKQPQTPTLHRQL
jgi:hypothetical protein